MCCHVVSSPALAPKFRVLFHESAWLLTGDDQFWSQLSDGARPCRILVRKMRDWIETVYRAMQLEPECLILAFVFIERLISSRVFGNVVCATTVRPLFLVAATISCKVWYDETTYCSDIVNNVCGNRYNLRTLVKAEATFLNAIHFKVVVSTKVYVRLCSSSLSLNFNNSLSLSSLNLSSLSSSSLTSSSLSLGLNPSLVFSSLSSFGLSLSYSIGFVFHLRLSANAA
ncbi:hypothetical protein T492DRAFT_839005 [Pavlovales sp. CCMP2436]|nr:hypothetical protein T492DRAFT_839005 [Pavlovales sp. CCMP2436]